MGFSLYLCLLFFLTCLDVLVVGRLSGVAIVAGASQTWVYISRNLPQINKRIGLFVAQEAININHQRLRRVDVHIIAVLWTLQVRIRIYKRFWPNVSLRFDGIFLFSRCERSAQARSTEEDIERGNNCCEFEDCSPAE